MTMKKQYLEKITFVLLSAILSALFIVTLFFSVPKTQIPPQSDRTVKYGVFGRDENGKFTYELKTAVAGVDFTAVNISDLGDLNKITKVNYVANEFVEPCSLSSDIQIVDLTEPFEFAEKGTLIFIILNLDPTDVESFIEQSERLSQYKIGNEWHFTLSLPKIFGASNVYSRTSLIARHGEIENYDFTEFNDNYDVKTERFSAMTESTSIDLSFGTRDVALADAMNAAQIITVHYQSTGSSYSGITDCPLIGTESSVKGINESSKNLLIAFAILSAVVFAVLVVLSVIERKNDFITAIVWVFGIAVLLFSRFMLTRSTSVPLLWVAFRLSSSFIILGGALFSVGRNFGKLPAKFIFTALSSIGALLAFIVPFIPFGAASVMNTVSSVIKGICCAGLFGFIGIATFDKADKRGVLQIVSSAIISVAIFASLFMPQVFPAQENPLFWLCGAAVVTTFVSVFIMFTDMKKSNVYLTANLHKEVERQVKDIKAVIADRDKLLQFVSHDMKKPLSSAVLLCNAAIERERDDEQIKTINIIKQDAERVINNLSEIAAYAKLNYLAEPSEVADMNELCALLYKFHQFDCDANGIVLKIETGKPVKAFVKQKGLENVVSNIIINAIEHANCNTITLSVKTAKNKVVLCVADDGKGIPNNIDVFRPYISENDTETSGLGLYICKNIIESMNGTLTYKTGPNGTSFYISLLKA